MTTSSRIRARRAQFERLERRDLMAADVTATLSNGVLRVSGTEGADNIQFIQGNGLIGVVGIYNAWSVAQVKAISVDLKGGNDRVSLDSVAYGWEPMAEEFTINSGYGTETVRLANGRDVVFSGLGHTLNVAANGAALLDGMPLPGSVVTATQVGSVLRVTGTEGADNIQFIQGNGLIGVIGIYNAWSASQITSIVVDLYGGNDRVSLDSVGYGWEPMAEAFTVNSGNGTETVRLAGGRDVVFSGPGHTMNVAANGAALLDGMPLPGSVVTATQVGSVLRVTGTEGADNIQFLQGNGLIGVVGIYNAWSVAQVTSIVVDLYGGDDRVSLDSVGFGWEPMAEEFTINSGNGSETVRLASAHDVVFSGSGHTLKVAANGTALLDGVAVNVPQPTNWFDAHIVDEAMRSLGSSLYSDGTINRNDMIELLRAVKDGNTVDSTELNDLSKIVANTSLFGAMDYVWKLATYVVSANLANSQYLGQALGNLTVGSTGAHLENLIGKWFLGLDHPTAAGTYRQFSGQLFVNGASYSDIRQGNLGNCYFVASLGEVALRNQAAINSMFIVNGDSTYTVKFYNGGVAQYVTVDSYLPTNASGALIYAARGVMYNNANGELWTALAEKAYVQLNEFGWQRPGLPGSGQNSYAAIEGGYIYAAMGHITGQGTIAFASTTAGSGFSTFVTAFNAGKSIGFASNPGANTNGVVGSHAYAVVGYDAASQKVTLFNPWGTEYGLLTLSWSQIQQSFGYFDRTA